MKKSPHRLNTFPVPYPGESFYSVLCRYHVRSGNLNSWCTRMQLFGYNASLQSTLISAYHLENFGVWVPESSGITAESMVMKHTAFTLYSLTPDPWISEDIRKLLEGEAQPCRRLCNIQRNLIHPAGFLRYCPDCARKQKHLYGESYWQILPQLEGAEFCPIHKRRFLCSPIRLVDIRWNFHPASIVLESPQSEDRGTEEKIYSYHIRLYLTALAENIGWFLENGSFPGGYQRLAEIYSEKFGCYRRYFWYPGIPREKIFKSISQYPEEVRKLIEETIFKYTTIYNNRAYVYDFKACCHIMLMMALSGSVKAFIENA